MRKVDIKMGRLIKKVADVEEVTTDNFYAKMQEKLGAFLDTQSQGYINQLSQELDKINSDVSSKFKDVAYEIADEYAQGSEIDGTEFLANMKEKYNVDFLDTDLAFNDKYKERTKQWFKDILNKALENYMG